MPIKTITLILLPLLRFLIPKCRVKLIFHFDTNFLSDGLGAQLQRYLSVLSLANYLRIPFCSDKLREIAIHPLDGFQSHEEYVQFLVSVNSFIGLHRNISEEKYPTTKCFSVKRLTLFKLIFMSLFSISGRIKLRIENSYPIIDMMTRIYEFGRHELFNVLETKSNNYALHYRVGAGGMSIYPGQNTPRELDSERYINLIHKLNIEKKFTVYTDCPSQNLVFRVPDFQKNLWIGTPGYSEGDLSIIGLNLSEIFLKNGIDTKIECGGNPLVTICEMANSEILICSKSSLSYVAALIGNHKEVYLPKDFWHPPLKKWKTF